MSKRGAIISCIIICFGFLMMLAVQSIRESTRRQQEQKEALFGMWKHKSKPLFMAIAKDKMVFFLDESHVVTRTCRLERRNSCWLLKSSCGRYYHFHLVVSEVGNNLAVGSNSKCKQGYCDKEVMGLYQRATDISLPIDLGD